MPVFKIIINENRSINMEFEADNKDAAEAHAMAVWDQIPDDASIEYMNDVTAITNHSIDSMVILVPKENAPAFPEGKLKGFPGTVEFTASIATMSQAEIAEYLAYSDQAKADYAHNPKAVAIIEYAVKELSKHILKN